MQYEVKRAALSTYEPSMTDLPSKGYVVVRQFLGESERLVLLRDYENPQAFVANGNYDVVPASPAIAMRFSGKLQRMCEIIAAQTGIQADLTTDVVYFATTNGIRFPWHQDHEDYFSFYDHVNYLNFYIPIAKPSASRSNVCVIPFDRLFQSIPMQVDAVLGKGARTFSPLENTTEVRDDETDERTTWPINIEDLCETPQLEAGDLLILRGDMIHRTQDADTKRVAVSFRRQSSASVVNRRRLMSGGVTKRQFMKQNSLRFSQILRYFAEADTEELTVGHLMSRMTLERLLRR